MHEIQTAASYVRNAEASRDEGVVLASLQSVTDLQPADASHRLWELLETPQTVETICRVLNNEFDLPPDACIDNVKIALNHLYREDLIEMTPDT